MSSSSSAGEVLSVRSASPAFAAHSSLELCPAAHRPTAADRAQDFRLRGVRSYEPSWQETR